MLSLYVDILASMSKLDRVGGKVSIGQVAKLNNISYYKAKKAVSDLRDFGLVTEEIMDHRPNVQKRVYFPTFEGAIWCSTMAAYRMEGF